MAVDTPVSSNSKGYFVVDENVIACLPKGATILKTEHLGSSPWNNTAKISTILANGCKKAYFLKWTAERGGVMMRGEFASLTAIREVSPSLAPEPHGWGKLGASDAYFLLMDFLPLGETSLRDPAELCDKIAELHLKSASPTGQFGFAAPTCHGKNLQPNTWTPSWSACFKEVVTWFFDEDVRVNGQWAEFDAAFSTLRTETIFRVLEPLQTGGRRLKPCLVHGDLWEENAGVHDETGGVVLFDAACMYAHNEYELGMWRRDVVKFGQPHIEEYLKRVPRSEPAEQWDDRNRLYSIKFNLGHSISFPGSRDLRRQILDDMNYLNKRYCTARYTDRAEVCARGLYRDLAGNSK